MLSLLWCPNINPVKSLEATGGNFEAVQILRAQFYNSQVSVLSPEPVLGAVNLPKA